MNPRLGALFVEDHADYREQIAWMLAEEGFDLVLTDICLPKMSCVARAWRVLALAPQTGVIFSSGCDMGNRLSHRGLTSAKRRPNVRTLLKPFVSTTCSV